MSVTTYLIVSVGEAIRWRVPDVTVSSAWWRPIPRPQPPPPAAPPPRRCCSRPSASRVTGVCRWSVWCRGRAGAPAATAPCRRRPVGGGRRRRRPGLTEAQSRRWRPWPERRYWSAPSTTARSRFRTTCRSTTSAHFLPVSSVRFYTADCLYSQPARFRFSSCSGHWSQFGLHFKSPAEKPRGLYAIAMFFSLSVCLFACSSVANAYCCSRWGLTALAIQAALDCFSLAVLVLRFPEFCFKASFSSQNGVLSPWQPGFDFAVIGLLLLCSALGKCDPEGVQKLNEIIWCNWQTVALKRCISTEILWNRKSASLMWVSAKTGKLKNSKNWKLEQAHDAYTSPCPLSRSVSWCLDED